jgi:Sulfite exporter TauE/SafE
VAGLGYVASGQVAWHALLWMLPGSIPGIMLGSQISVGIPDRVLRIAFSVVLMLSGIKLLQPLPGRWTNVAVLVGLALSAFAFAVWGTSYLLSRRRGVRAAGEPAP